MNYAHCDDYEMFLSELAFGPNQEKLPQLHAEAEASLEPLAQNLSEEEMLHQAMDDCWDSEWINPLTGIPHYHAANVSLTNTSLQPTLMEQMYAGNKPTVIPTWGDEEEDDVVTTASSASSLSSSYKPPPMKCTFCLHKFGDKKRVYTHYVRDCRSLKNTTCKNCGEKGHTYSYCPN